MPRPSRTGQLTWEITLYVRAVTASEAQLHQELGADLSGLCRLASSAAKVVVAAANLPMPASRSFVCWSGIVVVEKDGDHSKRS